MTAPPRAKTAARSQQAAQKSTKGADKPRQRSAAAERAYARREERRERSLREPSGRRPRQQRQLVDERKVTTAKPKAKARQLQERVSQARLPQVVMVMTVLATGLAATLWLSIAAVSGSYRLQQGESDLTVLTERKEQLLREVSSMNSTPEIQRRAEQELGMVPAPIPAHLVPQPDGSVAVVGEPEKARAPQTPAAPPSAPNSGAQPPEGQARAPEQPAADAPERR
ncbi:hypothetical protein GCM10011581_10190 [Saccharopolyspora subtropica]|uniref:Cell division protein FtsL n=1 Tax=Saccharopolyspora thermophila TaxID=89367 RepID=A0A917JN88_9PSEU|nr:hypothetical protein [Saccharopolyspora subtropica]GGI75132.1 hypothetical protein GCM10011581_10190 [Saccharopolyspora subtropica]